MEEPERAPQEDPEVVRAVVTRINLTAIVRQQVDLNQVAAEIDVDEIARAHPSPGPVAEDDPTLGLDDPSGRAHPSEHVGAPPERREIFAVHLRKRKRLPEDFEGLAGLIIPGGESTTMRRLIDKYSFISQDCDLKIRLHKKGRNKSILMRPPETVDQFMSRLIAAFKSFTNRGKGAVNHQ